MVDPGRITELREAKGLARSGLAKLMGVYPSYITDWETGRRKPSKKLLPKLAELLGVDVDELTDEPAPVVAMRPIDEAYLITVPETAQFLRCSTTTVHNLIAQRSLPHLRIGPRKVMIPMAALRAWVDAETAKSVSA
jgi:excisionase family DNA binding protein